MLSLSEADGPSSERRDWSERSEYWVDLARKHEPKRLKRQRRTHPLILSGHGVSLNIENGALVIKNGFTHYPQAREQYRFFPGDLDAPERIIMLDGSGGLSFAVIAWLGDQNITLVRIGWKGDAFAVISGCGSQTDPDKLRWQFGLQQDPKGKVDFAAEVICRKLTASRETLRSRFGKSPTADVADSKIADGMERLTARRISSIDDVLAVEGGCARAYFEAWRGLELQFRGENRNPIPPTWRIYDQRSSILSGKKAENYKAAHPINAMLNYGYAILEAETRIKIISEGYDPRIGILHGGKRGRGSSFVFDLMEPQRPVIDGAVLEFAVGQMFSAKDFAIRNDGACRLSPQLARTVTLRVHSALMKKDAGRLGGYPNNCQ